MKRKSKKLLAPETDITAVLGKFVLRGKKFENEVYRALCNMRWKRVKDRAIVSWSWRGAGSLVSELVGRGDYMDYYCSGNEGVVSRRLERILRQKGWVRCPLSMGKECHGCGVAPEFDDETCAKCKKTFCTACLTSPTV